MKFVFLVYLLVAAVNGVELENIKSNLLEKAIETYIQDGLRLRLIKSQEEPLALRDTSGKLLLEKNLVRFSTEAVTSSHMMRDLEISIVNLDVKNHHVEVSLHVPSTLFQGQYQAEGQLNAFDVVLGKGFFEVKGHEVTIKARGALVEKDGQYRVAGLTLKSEQKAFASYFENLVGSSSNLKTVQAELGRAILSEYRNQVNIKISNTLSAQINNLLSGFYESSGRAEIGNANAYIDQVLQLVRQQVIAEGLDRIPLMNISIGFSQDVWLVGNVRGECGLYDGVLTGFETLHRIRDDATFEFNENYPNIVVNATVGINNALLSYVGSITFMDIGPKITLSGTLAYANLFFEAQVGLEPLVVSISKFDIEDIGHIDIEIVGLGPFNWLGEIIIGTVINAIKGIVKEIIEGPMRRIIEWAVLTYIDSILNPVGVAASLASGAVRLAL